MATSVSFQADDVVFRKNDPAEWFYILIRGRIKLCPDKVQTNACWGECTGEAFGWDSLIDQKYYRTSAVCVGPTVVLKLSRRHMNLILNEDPYSAAIFFRQLAGALGNCLMERWISNATTTKSNVSKKSEIHELA
jgi:CRP-like cAMP-binding protein